jgi:F-type H+-transporting ATPase subunit a
MLIFGKKESGEFSVDLFAERLEIMGVELSSTVVLTWGAMLVVLAAALFVRARIIRRMKDEPRGAQNLIEFAIEWVSGYSESQASHLGENLAAYMFTIAVFMLASACVELAGFRTPTSDITMTLAMALVTFFLINYYGIRQKGLLGRIKSFGKPMAGIAPIKLVTDIAVPVSLACRLFGNMLGGMIVMELLYYALGNFGILFPSVLGLFFNVFHPVIQAYVFVTLSLIFINEAAERHG